jgi:dihydrofolate reductase
VAPPSQEPQHDVDARWTANLMRPRGAYVMGRNMYGPVRGSWETLPDWRGWWGEEPPYHAPVFVLTHHEHEPIEMEGGTTFHFVTGGLHEALDRAREAGDGDVDIAGGASAVRQALAAGELDELTLDIIPVLLGDGERIFGPDVRATLDQVEVDPSPGATHVRYRVRRDG